MKMNQLKIKSGRLPEQSDEVVLDALAKDKGYKIGDTITIEEPDYLARDTFTVVGFVQSPLFINALERGFTNVGNGTVDYFIYLPEENFTSEVQSVIYFSFKNVAGLETYSDAYQNKMDKNRLLVESAFKDRAAARLKEVQDEATETLTSAKEKVISGEEQLAEGQAALDSSQQTLNEQKKMLSQLPATQQAAGQVKLAEAQATLATNQEKLLVEKQKLADAKAEIEKNEQEIQDMAKPTYLFRDRS